MTHGIMARRDYVHIMLYVAIVTLVLMICIARWDESNSKLDVARNELPTLGIPRELIDPDSWLLRTLPDHLQNRSQDDPELIQQIRAHWIIQPSQQRLHLDPEILKRARNKDFSEWTQSSAIATALHGRRDGFFVECGAADGQRNSNTLYLELFYNWTGLLIEVNPKFFRNLLAKNRDAYLVSACLSPIDTPTTLTFLIAGVFGGIYDYLASAVLEKTSSRQVIQIQCLPLYSLLAAVGIKHVDYFSLDIEGAEVGVLETFPFDHVTIDTMTIENRVKDNKTLTDSKKDLLADLMKVRGYNLTAVLGSDLLFSRL